MAVKENVQFIKDELSSEEKFIESFVKVERFYKKNKLLIITLLVALVAFIIGYSVYGYVKESNKQKANIAFNSFLLNNNDDKALESIKEYNSKLYEVALFIKTKNSDNTHIPDVLFLDSLAKYKNALEKQNQEELTLLSQEKNFLLKEFALFNKALLEVQEGNIDKAKETLKLIPTDSQIKELVNLLNHYIIVKS